ncbi:Hypothetical protein SCLAV_2789 [Streptomyces clavuligerus]|uniref:Uncharacterized protein n=1 Tax=Streptomyces clavuligerus TaxID=1901 RepID=E2PVE7_STRCL|nr:Hypothetical protein SCLAV_2789 [Streptomyces clavuligerus]
MTASPRVSRASRQPYSARVRERASSDGSLRPALDSLRAETASSPRAAALRATTAENGSSARKGSITSSTSSTSVTSRTSHGSSGRAPRRTPSRVRTADRVQAFRVRTADLGRTSRVRARGRRASRGQDRCRQSPDGRVR